MKAATFNQRYWVQLVSPQTAAAGSSSSDSNVCLMLGNISENKAETKSVSIVLQSEPPWWFWWFRII